jgi:uncharacterized membrane protein
MARVLIAGESWVTTSIHAKGFDSFTTVDYQEGVAGFRDALERRGHEVWHMPAHVAASEFPFEASGLDGVDVVVLSDLGANTLLLPPATFTGHQTRPNRLELLRDWVAGGGGLSMIGGYLSFQGIEAKANYRNTPLAEALPVLMEVGDDRSENPQGIAPTLADPGDPLVAGLAQTWPEVLGYQRAEPRPGAKVPVTVGGTPLVAYDQHGAGRSLAFMTDIGPHWAPEAFFGWPGFEEFWDRAITWLAGGLPSAVGGNGAEAHVG